MRMTPAEIIEYCHSGVLESVTAEQLLQVVGFCEKAVPNCNERQSDAGYEDGYLDAIDEMKGKLNSM